MNNIIKRVWIQNRLVNIEDLTGMVFQAEIGAHTFEISGIDDTGATVSLSGTVAGVFRRADNADIALTGSAAGGVVSVTLTDDCYAVPGRFALTIFVTADSQTTAVYAAVGTVASTSGGAVAGDTPQDVVDLINAIAAAVATIPASYTNLVADIAPTYSNTALYAVGAYAWYNGTLYRCTTAITTPEAWTAAHWTAAVLGDDVSDLKSALSQITDEETVTTDTALTLEKHSDYYYWNGSASANSEYYYVHITDLQESDIITLWASATDHTLQLMRFIDAYNGTTRVASASSSSDVTSYTVPSGVDNVYITGYERFETSSVFHRQRADTVFVVKGLTELKNSVDRLLSIGKNYITFTADSVNANTDYIVKSRIDNKKNCVYTMFGKFSAFTSLIIGHGYSNNNATYMTIDDTNLTIYGTGGSQYQKFAHGLTMTDFIDVIIKVADTSLARANVTIRTATGEYTKSDVIFFGCSGGVWFHPKQSMTEVKFTYILLDMLKDVYVFGDSYTSLADPNRWPKYTIDAGYNGTLLSGYGGVTSQGELVSFDNIMGIKKPKTCAWFLGMNDPDPSDGINSSWKSAVESVISYCETNGIELVLATIPNTPTMNNMFKNDYVRTSGYRYVDFAKAVNAESANASWYSGMLSSDNVHPTADGAKALASRVILDFPEISG